MNKLLPFLLFFIMMSSFCVTAESADMADISELIGKFAKMSDGLDKLKCRPADGRSIYGFYLSSQMRKIPYTFEEDNEYVLLMTSAQKAYCQIKQKRDGRVLADQKGSRIYMKYSAKSTINTELCITADSDGDAAILIIMCRDRYSLNIPFEDFVSSVREMADNAACRSRDLTDKTEFFLLGGTFGAYESDEYVINEGLATGLRFGINHSKTVSDTVLEFHRGSGTVNRINEHGVQSFDVKTTRQARYSVLYENDSPSVYEHGIVLLAIMDR